MKKKLSLLALTGIIALASCSTLPTPTPASQPSDSWVTPATSPRYPMVVIGGIVGTPNVTGDVPEQSWLEVTAFYSTRPDTGGPCTAVATEQPDHRVAVEPVGCSGTSTAVITVTELSGRISHQFVGAQRLIFTQRGQGEPVAAPTFTFSVEGQQIWPQ